MNQKTSKIKDKVKKVLLVMYLYQFPTKLIKKDLSLQQDKENPRFINKAKMKMTPQMFH